MDSSADPSVTVSIGGKHHTATFGLATLAMIEDRTGRGVMDLAIEFIGGTKYDPQQATRNFRLSVVIPFVQACLPELERRATPLNLRQLGEVFRALTEGFLAACTLLSSAADEPAKPTATKPPEQPDETEKPEAAPEKKEHAASSTT